MRERNQSRSALLTFLSVTFMGVCAAHAAYKEIPLNDTGWSAIIDEGLNNQVGIHVMGVQPTANTIVLELDKWFIGNGPENGFNPIIIKFQKKTANPYTRLVISDEYITNDTPSDWHDFHMFLSPGSVGFDNLAVPSGGPFHNVSFADFTGLGGRAMELNFSNGMVPHNSPNNIFQPGYQGGDIVILTDPAMGTNGIPNSFILKELPSTPEPASLLLLVGGIIGLTRGRTPNKRT